MDVEYAVEFVSATELPESHDWMLIRQGTRKTLFVKQERICPELIRDLWIGLHEVNGDAQAKLEECWPRST